MPSFRFRRFLLMLLAVSLPGAACGGGCDFAVGRTAQDSSASSAAAPAEDPAAPAARPRIVALGDSLTAGYGLLESQSYPAVLQEHIDRDGYAFEVVNAGVSGDTSAGGLRRLDWALDGDVRVLIVALGANDGLRGLSADEMKENLTAIIARARERRVVVILAGMEAPPNYGPEYATSFRQAFRDVAQQERVLFLPFLLDKVAGENALNQRDGIHPNAQGARMVADTVWTVLRPLLDQLAAAS
ncbi:MAG TPA: arylesterase [Vicinamibacterales bacterium]|nr:arylesterase [Vicinamibacterales bacterium]